VYFAENTGDVFREHNKFIERDVKTRWSSTKRMIDDAVKKSSNEYVKCGGLEEIIEEEWKNFFVY
jgi:hypothetical protein